MIGQGEKGKADVTDITDTSAASPSLAESVVAAKPTEDAESAERSEPSTCAEDLSIEEALSRYGFVLRPVEGDSMMPMLDQARDIVRIVPLSAPIGKYDLPLYRRPSGQYVLHRVIAVRKDHCVTCGDNRWRSEKVPYAWLVGIAEGFYKNGNYISCTDEAYLSYVRRRVGNRFSRAVRAVFRRLFLHGKKNR